MRRRPCGSAPRRNARTPQPQPISTRSARLASLQVMTICGLGYLSAVVRAEPFRMPLNEAGNETSAAWATMPAMCWSRGGSAFIEARPAWNVLNATPWPLREIKGRNRLMRLSLVSGGVMLVDWIRSGADDAGQLSHPAITCLPGLLRGGHTPAADLTVHPRLSRHLPQPGTCPPQPQHLTDRRHGNLPECHLPEYPNPSIWKHPYRQVTKASGATRRVVPSPVTGWSHVGDGNPQTGPMIMAGDLCPTERRRGTTQGVPYDYHS
jgi:hypothetical protein